MTTVIDITLYASSFVWDGACSLLALSSVSRGLYVCYIATLRAPRVLSDSHTPTPVGHSRSRAPEPFKITYRHSRFVTHGINSALKYIYIYYKTKGKRGMHGPYLNIAAPFSQELSHRQLRSGWPRCAIGVSRGVARAAIILATDAWPI